MGKLRDALDTLPYAAMVVGSILLASYGTFSISRDLASEKVIEESDEYNREKFPELYENYEEYVSNIAKALEECNEDREVVKDFAFYLTMLDHGCISYGRDFKSGVLPVEFSDLLGATVATGHGVCRHTAYNLSDVLCSLGYDARVVVGRYYNKNASRPDDVNHAVVYVEENGIGYLLDPINGSIFLKKSGLVYYDIRSQEDNYICFEPTLSNNHLDESENNNVDLLLDFGNDFKHHWDVLKTFKEYSDNSNDYLSYFFNYEIKNLTGNEIEIKEVFDELVDKYNILFSIDEEKTKKTR